MAALMLTPVAAGGVVLRKDEEASPFVRLGGGVSVTEKFGGFQPFGHLVLQYNRIGLDNGKNRFGMMLGAGGFLHMAVHVEAHLTPQRNLTDKETELGAGGSVTAILPFGRTFGLGVFAEVPDLGEVGADGVAVGLQITGLIKI